MQRGQREIVMPGDDRGKSREAHGRLARRDDPGGDRERRVIAFDRPVDQRLPDRLLAGGECGRMGCPIANEVGAGIVCYLRTIASRCVESRSIVVPARRVRGIFSRRISPC